MAVCGFWAVIRGTARRVAGMHRNI